MAEKQAGGLSLRIGLTLSQLQSDFLAAEQTVKQGIAALNRQQNIVRLKMETDVTGLDSVADKTKILEVQERGLNQLLEMQRDRLTLATKAYQDYANSKNANATTTKNLEAAMERERLAVARLESQLKSLSAQRISIDTTQLQDNIAKLNAKIQHVKITAEIDTSKLKNSAFVFEQQKVHVAALTKELELQRQKLAELQNAMNQAAKVHGADSVQSLNIKSNVLQQIQEINRLETRLKELKNTRIDLQFRTDSIRRVEAEVSENISRINAKIEHIKVKTDIDVSKLGSAASEFDRAKAHVQGLNRELDLQNQKLAEMRRALAASISTNGLNNVKTINISTDIQKQIHEIDQLKAKIKELNDIKPPKTNGLLGGYLNIKGDITGKLNEITNAFSQLQGATSSADSAITATLGIIDAIPSPVGKAATALLALPIVFKGIENSIIDMTKAAASAGDSVYVMSRGFQMSIADTGKFTSMCKTAGVEVSDLSSTIRRVQQAIVRGGDDAKAEQMLKRYGESAFDASGRLKDLNEMTLTLSRALKRAQAEGNGMAFILATMRNASADAITAIEDAEGVYQQAAGLVKNGLADPVLAHEVQGNINALNLQASFMKASFESALLPVANEIVPRVTERMGKMTTLIKDNADLIKDFGRDLAEVWGAVESTVDKVTEKFSELAKLARENRVVRQTSTKDILDKYKDDESIQSVKDLLQAEIRGGGYTAEDKVKLQARTDLYQKELKRAEAELRELTKKRREEFAEKYKSILEKYKSDDGIKTMTDLLNKLTDAEKELISQDPSPFFSTLQEKVGVLNLELKKLRETSADTKQELEKLLKQPLSGANASSIGQERQKLESDEGLVDSLRQARKYRENAQAITDKLNLNDYQKQMYDLQQWFQEQLPREQEQSLEKYQAVMEEYRARSIQIEQERADKLQEIRDQINSADKTALENKLDNIEKERQAWLKAGMDEAEATELAEKKRLQVLQEANEKAQQYIKDAADIEYSLTHTAYEKQLRDIEQWKDAQLKKAETAEEVAAIIKNAAAKEAEAFEREVDRIKGATQSLEDEIYEMEHSRYETDIYRAVQKAQKALDEGVDFSVVSRWLNNKMADFNQRASEARAQGGDYVKSPTGGTMWSGLITPQLQRSTSLLSSENQIRGRLISTLSDEAKATAERIQAAKSAQMQSAVPDNLSGVPLGTATIIQGDQITQISPADLKAEMEKFQAQMQASFGTPIQQQTQPQSQAQPPIANETFKNLETSAQSAAEAQKTFADSLNNLPPDYFRQLADQAKAVATMQGNLKQSTIDLIDAQGKLSKSLATFPKAEKQSPVKETSQAIASTTKASSAETESQRALRQALSKVPDAVKPFQQSPSTDRQLPTKDFSQLADSTQDVRQAQDLLARTAAETRTSLENIRYPEQTQITPKDSGIKFGFDYDTAKDIFLTGAGIAAASAGTGVGVAFTPEILAGALVAAGIGGFAKGSYDETTAKPESTDFSQPLSEIDLSGIITPLTSIDGNLQTVLQTLQDKSIDSGNKPSESISPLNNLDVPISSIIQAMQEVRPYQTDALQELFGELPNIRADVQSIFQQMQARGEVESPVQTSESIGQDYLPTLINIDGNLQSVVQELQAQSPQETTMPVETIVTPLNNIAGLVQQVLSALSNRQPPQINVSPTNSINLGGAYVFDNALKKTLVDDITSQVVSAITSAVQQATSQSNYSYGA